MIGEFLEDAEILIFMYFLWTALTICDTLLMLQIVWVVYPLSFCLIYSLERITFTFDH